MSKQNKNLVDTKKKTEEVAVKKYDETGVLQLVDVLIDNFHKTVETSEGVFFNQSALVMLISAMKASKFRETANDHLRFFNVINKTINTANRKTVLEPEEIAISIEDKVPHFLMNAAYRELVDDYHLDSFLIKWAEQYNEFGTAVTKVINRGTGKSLVKVIDFQDFICDQNKAENNLMGEVKFASLKELSNLGKFSNEKIKEVEVELEKAMGQSNDTRNARLRLYELYGPIPKDLFGEDEAGYNNGVVVIAEISTDLIPTVRSWAGNKRIVLYFGKSDGNPYTIHKRVEMYNRTMGRGIAEEMLESQITSNEIANLILDQLRATSKVVYQTSDTELDGQDLQEIDNLTLISHEEGSPITQVSTQPTSYSALQSFMGAVVQLGREQSSIQESSLGRAPRSGTPYAAIYQAGKEADGQYIYYKNQIFRQFKEMIKLKDSELFDIWFGYVKSEKDIYSLLTEYQLSGFKKFIARKKAEKLVHEQVEKGFLLPDDVDEVSKFILEQDGNKKYKIKLDEKLDKKIVQDKLRLTLNTERDIITKQIELLERQLQLVVQSPDLFPNLNAERLLEEIMELQDLAMAHNVMSGAPTQEMDTGETIEGDQNFRTPTGPDVAQQAMGAPQVGNMPQL